MANYITFSPPLNQGRSQPNTGGPQRQNDNGPSGQQNSDLETRMNTPVYCRAKVTVGFLFLFALAWAIFWLGYNEAVIKLRVLKLLMTGTSYVRIPGFLVLSLSVLTAFFILLSISYQIQGDINKIDKHIRAQIGISCLILIMAVISNIIVTYPTQRINAATMRYAISRYHLNKTFAENLDLIQTKMQCCGIDNYTDWNYNREYRCSTSPLPLACSVPVSCCKPNKTGPSDGFCGKGALNFNAVVTVNRIIDGINKTVSEPASSFINQNGCMDIINEHIHIMGIYVVVLDVALFVLQVISIAFNIYTMDSMRKRQDSASPVELQETPQMPETAERPEPVQTDPESVQMAPKSVQPDPESVQTDPKSVQADPESVQTDPESVQADPESTRRIMEEMCQPGPSWKKTSYEMLHGIELKTLTKY